MRTFDFAPLYRSTIGFDRLFSTFDQLDGVGGMSNYPPYNIERTGENAYRISVAVAGFSDADLSIETKENRLAIRGEKQTNGEEKTGDVLYQGIAARTFERSFQLADYVKVKGASLENGHPKACWFSSCKKYCWCSRPSWLPYRPRSGEGLVLS